MDPRPHSLPCTGTIHCDQHWTRKYLFLHVPLIHIKYVLLLIYTHTWVHVYTKDHHFPVYAKYRSSTNSAICQSWINRTNSALFANVRIQWTKCSVWSWLIDWVNDNHRSLTKGKFRVTSVQSFVKYIIWLRLYYDRPRLQNVWPMSHRQ